MKRISRPNIAGITVTMLYGFLLFLAWFPMISPSADALEGVGPLILTLPTSIILSRLADSISIAITSHSAATGVHTAILAFSAALHATVLYFAAWGIVTFITRRKNQQ